MANTTKTLETINHLKNITENIIYDEKLPETMGPKFFPKIKNQLLQIMNDLNSLEIKVQLLHLGSQFPQAMFLNNHGKIFSKEEMLNSLETTNQTLTNVTAQLQQQFNNNPSQTPKIIPTLPHPRKTDSTPLKK